MKSRAIQRGKPLDKDCLGCKTTTGEYGQNDDRVFCYGLEDRRTDEPLPKCKECGAYVYNAKPLKELQNGQADD